MSHIAVIGAGYVGLVTASCFAEMGHSVACVEVNGARVAALRRGQLPIEEPGLQELWTRHLETGALSITEGYAEALEGRDFVFLCVGTPSLPDGRVNLEYVMMAARSIGAHAHGAPTVVIKSTVPVGTAAMVAAMVNARRRPSQRLPVVSNPEFLREGEAVRDFLQPDRVIAAAEAVASLYRPLNCPLLFCDNATAEMIKYASNAFLATKISFVNELAGLCERVGVDVQRVAQGMGMDHRIGPHFLGAGLGWGGSCLPKDTGALLAMGRGLQVPLPLLSAVVQVNAHQPRAVVHKLAWLLGSLEGRTVGVWGLTFKANTDDLRESPALVLLDLLRREGCQVRAYDPVVCRRAQQPVAGVAYARDPYDAVRGAHAVVLATAWPEFLSLDMARVRQEMAGDVVLDARNALDPVRLRRLGFTYVGIGRNGVAAPEPPPTDGVVQPVAAPGAPVAAAPHFLPGAE